MAETFEQFVDRHLTEITQQTKKHANEISQLLKRQEDEIRRNKGLTPALESKFNRQLEELQTIHKDIEAKLRERHDFEKDLSDKEFKERQTLKQIIRGNYKPDDKDLEKTKDKDDDYDDYEKE